MALDIDILTKEICNTEDFKSLYDELKRMTYFLYDYKIVNYSNAAVSLDPKNNSARTFLEKLISDFQKIPLLGEDKDKAIRLVNHFIFTIIVMGYIWDAINEYKLRCNGEALFFTETTVDNNPFNPLTIFYNYNGARIILEIKVKATKINGDKTLLFIKVCTPIASLTESDYLNKIKITVVNGLTFALKTDTFTLSNLNINNLQELIEQAVDPKKI